MREPDCFLVRVGEQALKSEQVREKWMSILLDNIRTYLQKKNIKFSFEVNPNRIFIYTKERRKVKNLLKRVFGITSFSEAWKCHSNLDEIKLLAVDVAEHLNINKRCSFAIRARRAGRHSFSSKTIAEEAGAAVKRVTNAKVNLTNPHKEIFIETRSRNTYIFTEKIPGPGGVPLGTSGEVGAVLRGRKDVISCWLIMRRGCTLKVVSKRGELLRKIRRWHIGRELKVVNTLDNSSIKAVIMSGEPENRTKNIFPRERVLILRPLDGLGSRELKKLAKIVL